MSPASHRHPYYPNYNDPALFCQTCSCWTISTRNLAQHTRGKRHKKNLESIRVAEGPGFCDICQVDVPLGRTNWTAHTVGFRHQSKCKLQTPDTNHTAAPSVDKWFCDACNRLMDQSNEEAHKRGRAHLASVKNAAFSAALLESEKNKYGVSISEEDGLDFGFINVETLSAGPSLSKALVIRGSSLNLRLKNVRLSASISSAFSFTCVPMPHAISTIAPLCVTIVCAPGPNRGHLNSRIEFVFEDASVNQEFVIARPIRAIVGVQSDYDMLRAVAPYVRRKREASFQVKGLVSGPRPAAKSNIPYVMDLGEYPLNPSVVVLGTEEERTASIRRLLPTRLNADTYKQHWQLLLYCEEHQMAMDMEEFDMTGTTLSQHQSFYFLNVPGLAEKRPSVLRGDTIHLRIQAQPNTWYEGHVSNVRGTEISLKFHEEFNYRLGQLCDVRFTVPRIPLRRMHQALDRPFYPRRILFPSSEDIREPGGQLRDIKTFNPLIEANAPQLQAVIGILNQVSGSVPFVVFGPPGTGKTITTVEAIVQLLAKNPTYRILACAPSNAAADLITLRLIEANLPDLGPHQLFRMNGPSRVSDHVPLKLGSYTFKNRDGFYSVPNMARMLSFRVIVSTCVSASIPYNIGMPAGHFSHIFIDEAGQAMEPESMISIKTMGGPETNVVLSGDPQQLGPIIRSGVARNLGLGMSYLERLMLREIYNDEHGASVNVVKLTKNWRSHNAILTFPNNTFYNSELEECGDPNIINSLIGSPVLPNPKFPIVFHGIAGNDDREAGSPSYFNIDEVSLVVSYVDSLRESRTHRITDDDIGIITPYNAQGAKLRTRLRSQRPGIDVGSVEIFQGQERKVIIMSTVRSDKTQVPFDLRHALGFLVNPRRLNVAITRARAMLIVIGDPRVLGLDPLWRKFLNYIHINGGWTGLDPDWDPADIVEDAEPNRYVDIRTQRLTTEMEELTSRLRERVVESLQTSAPAGEYDEEMLESSGDRPSREDNI